MPATPRLSVIIATYNRGPRLAPTLDSLGVQSTPPSEIVLSDDGSTDGTAEWVRAHYPGVVVISHSNAGTSAARNRGAERATGDVLIFLDHDDELLPGALATLTETLLRFPQARAAFADHQLRNVADGEFFPNHHTAMPAFERLRAVPAMATSGDVRLYGTPLLAALLHGNLLQQPWAVYRSDFAALGGFDQSIRYCEDWELYLRVTRHAPVALTDRVISTHVIEGSNLHRAAGQDIQHMAVLRKQLRLHSGDWRAVRTIRRRLANYLKTRGDQARSEGRSRGWAEYAQSFVTWPFDAVVAARCVTHAPGALWDAVRRGARR